MTLAVGETVRVASATPPPRVIDRAADRLRAVAATRLGRLAMVALFATMMFGLRMPLWWAIAIVLATIAAFPRHRRVILVPAAVAFAYLAPPVDFALLSELAPRYGATAAMTELAWAAIPITWAMAFAYLWVVRRFPKSPVARRPVTGLIAILFALMAARGALPLSGAAWVIVAGVAMCFASYVWFFAYWVSENHAPDKARPLLRTGFWRPFWGFTKVPYGKGAAYLDRAEAKNDAEFAAAQLKGLKLLLWACVLTAVMVAANKFVYRLGPETTLSRLPEVPAPNAIIPTYEMSLDALKSGTPYPLPTRWAALVLFFILRITQLTLWGAKIIAVARMAGYNVFRNTYRPFEAPTIAEYYNRIYYYFKELLVTFFFYPTYLRYFKKWPRVRLFMATLAAAGLGNWLFHFLRDQDLIMRHGFWQTMRMYHSYAAYALVLGVAIGVSQLRSNARERGRCKPPTGWARVRSTVFIILFFLMICTFLEPSARYGLGDYANYCVRLFVP